MKLPQPLQRALSLGVGLWACAWMIVLITIGTLAQAAMPLERAIELYFAPPIIWLGGVVPVPGVPPTLAIIAGGLLWHTVRAKVTLANLGSWLAHVGVLLLVVAGLIATLTLQNGLILVQEGQTTRLWQETGPDDVPLTARKVIGPLPFTVTLTQFEHRTYPGTDLPEMFASHVTITPADGTPWQAVIRMNEPLQVGPYTLYQSGYDDPPGRPVLSVLSVAHDRFRSLPLLATVVLCIALLAQVILRMGLGTRWAKRFLPLLLVMLPLAHPEAQTRTLTAADLHTLATLPVQHEGRVKPLGTFAAHTVPLVMGTDVAPEATLPILLNWLTAPAVALNTPLMHVQTQTLEGLPPSPTHTPLAVMDALAPLETELANWAKLPAKQHSKQQAELLQLDTRLRLFLAITHTFDLLRPLVELDEATAALLKLPKGPTDATALLSQQEILLNALNDRNYTPELQQRLMLAVLALKQAKPEEPNGLLRFIPPYPDVARGHIWLSPWQAARSLNTLTPDQLSVFNGWRTVLASPNAPLPFNAMHTATQPYSRPLVLQLEWLGVRYPLLTMAMIPLLLAALVFRWPSLAATLTAAGLVLMTAGIALRMVVLQRPPVATLYESLLFAALVLGGTGLVMRKKAPIILPATAAATAGLLGVAHGIVGSGDSMGMLTAVLNTNFWLATHVLVIVSGYGASMLVGLLALLLLASPAMQRKLAPLLRHGVVIAMLLTAVGTLLGGWWAAQSWGRFWGWDPKENGALVLTLWLVIVSHLRLLQPPQPTLHLALAALTPVVVALSWFGVNLLGIGLHSYGFITGVAWGLFAFCLGYSTVVGGLLVWRR